MEEADLEEEVTEGADWAEVDLRKGTLAFWQVARCSVLLTESQIAGKSIPDKLPILRISSSAVSLRLDHLPCFDMALTSR